MHHLATSKHALFGSAQALFRIDVAALPTRGMLAVALVALIALGCWCIRAQLR